MSYSTTNAAFDCRASYDPARYAAHVQAERAAATRTVFATVFFGVGMGQAGRVGYLATGSSSGAISIFNLEAVLRRSRGRENALTTTSMMNNNDGGGDDGDVAAAAAAAAVEDEDLGPSLVIPAHTGRVGTFHHVTLQSKRIS
jgi:hypothetical protein